MMQAGRYNGASPWHTWDSFVRWLESLGFTLQAHSLDRIWFRHRSGRWFQVPQPVRLKVVEGWTPHHADRKNADALLDDRLIVPDDVVFQAARLAEEIAHDSQDLARLEGPVRKGQESGRPVSDQGRG